ncbi:MAG: hypothetical protein ACFB9N_05090 [Geitlerinemataceae cyanobacterium]
MFVGLQNVATVLYGWNSPLAAADRAIFGHTDVEGATLAKPVVFGTDRPKPARAQIKTSGVTSFVDKGQLTNPALRSIKREVAPARPAASEKSVMVFIDVGGVDYCWRQPVEVRNKIGATDLAALGVQVMPATVKGILSPNSIIATDGTEILSPVRARKAIEGGGTGDVDTVSTMISDGVTLPAGWS